MNIKLLVLALICIGCQNPQKDNCIKENFYGYPCKDIDYEKWKEFERRAKPIRGDR